MKNLSKYLFFTLGFFIFSFTKIHAQNKLIPFQKKEGNLFGFKSTTGKVVVKPQYDWVGYTFINGYTLVEKNNKVGVMNDKGSIVISIKYDGIDIYAFAKDSVFWVNQNDKYGFIDKAENIIIPIKYESVGNYHNGQYLVKENGNWGLVNFKGDILLPIKYSKIVEPFCNGFATVEIGYGDYSIDYDNYKCIKFGYVDTLHNEFLYHVDSIASQYENFTVQSELFNNKDLFKINDTIKLKKEVADSLLTLALAKFKIPDPFADYCKLNKKCVGLGLLLNGNILREYSFFNSNKEAKYFTKNTFYKIISTQYLREITWTCILPLYKKTFQSSSPIIQKTYKNIAIYLKNYINNYDKDKVEEYLKRDEKNFAFLDINGNFDSNRKLSAFIDRLIIIHKIISVEDAKYWINKISDEVLSW